MNKYRQGKVLKTEGKTRIIHVRLPQALWDKFGLVCMANDTSPAEMIRELMRIIVREEAASVREWQERQKEAGK